MLQSVFLLILLLIAASPVSGQQSQVQRCEAMQNSGDAAIREYCLRIFAASGYREPRDMTAAMQHYQKAAEMGNADAQAVMGVAYEHGTNVAKNLELAVKWYQKTAAQSHAGAQLNLGQLYAKGEGVPRDAAKARQLNNGPWAALGSASPRLWLPVCGRPYFEAFLLGAFCDRLGPPRP